MREAAGSCTEHIALWEMQCKHIKQTLAGLFMFIIFVYLEMILQAATHYLAGTTRRAGLVSVWN